MTPTLETSRLRLRPLAEPTRPTWSRSTATPR
jgi:hypothetical protein